MRVCSVGSILFLTSAIAFLPNSPTARSMANSPGLLQEAPLRISKLSPVISETARNYLVNRDGNLVKVWVFFTDKQVDSKSDFASAASKLNLGEKVSKRRAKVKLDQIVFADLPVSSEYIKRINTFGARHRRTSKWQNAASFEIPVEKLTEISELPFVSEITPVAVSRRSPLPQIDYQKKWLEPGELSPDALNYGNSAAQLIQISIDKLHARGFHGEGVTLAILDTGFRKSHEAFATHFAENRVLAEHDFIFNDGNTANEPFDDPDQWSHGTIIWSVSGGLHDGDIYGPAYQANFLLAKTEDVRSETPIEEDNWVAAVEWADSLGADVLTSSLGYIDWYTPDDLDGQTAVTTIEANMAAAMGIVLCNAAGNGGPNPSTLWAPSDAFDILAVGSVNGLGTIANTSSRGPTADGRIKPEVCARGVHTWCANINSDSSYGTSSGTSLSTPLVAGAACLMVQARPNFPPTVIRRALMETADNAADPNDSLGWGVINADAAYQWGAEFLADTTTGNAPITIQFTANSSLPVSSWNWSFGDGGMSTAQNPSHQYIVGGIYDVSLTVQTAYGQITNVKEDYIVLYADTVRFERDSAFAGQQVIISVNLTNSRDLLSLTVPFKYGSVPDAAMDSVSRGIRTGYFESLSLIGQDAGNNKYGYELIADTGGGAPALPVGSGEILRIYLTLDSLALGSLSALIDSTSFPSNPLRLSSSTSAYTPTLTAGEVSTRAILRCDPYYDFDVDIIDLNFLVNRFSRGGAKPVTIQAGDCNADLAVTILDLNYLVNYIFRGGPPPPNP